MTLDNALNDLLDTHTAEQAARRVVSAPKGYEPGVAYEADGSMLVTTPPMPQLGEDEWDEAVAAFIKVPEGFKARLVAATYDPAAWHRDADRVGEKHSAYTAPVWRYKFHVAPDLTNVSADDLLDEIRRWKPRKRALPTGSMAYLVAPGDMQFGKSDGDGTEGIVIRFMEKIDQAADRLVALRKQGHSIGEVYLSLLGDCIEGTVSQGGRLIWRLDLTLTEMVRVYRRLVLYAVKRLAPLAERLVVIAIPGNHDEAVRVGDKMATRYDDSWAIEGCVAVADALADRDDFKHVSFVFPGKDELTVTVDMAGTIVGFAHGHQFGSGKDAAHTWWAKQAHGIQPIGDATLLMAGHLHHLRVEQPGAKTFIQVPALDGGSTWFKHRTGAEADPGLVTLLVGNGGWSNLEVL